MERAGDQRPYRFYRSHFAGHLAGTPGKILGTRSEWVERNPNTARALVAAVLDAARWIDASEENKRETARILAKRARLNTKEQYLTGRMLGEYDNGLGQRWQDAHPIRFYDPGRGEFSTAVGRNVVLTQFRRWGLLKRPRIIRRWPGASTALTSGKRRRRRWAASLRRLRSCAAAH